MKRFLSSATLTVSLGVLAALYLGLGRQGILPLHPAGMIAFAAMLICQSGFALVSRILTLRRRSPHAVPAERDMDWGNFANGFEEAERALRARGFCSERMEGGEITVFSKRVRTALILEIVFYGALIAVLFMGMVNYAAGISGSFMIAPSIVPVDLKGAVQDFQKGFLADLSGLDDRVKVDALAYTTKESRSTVDLEISDRQGKKIFSGRLKAGEGFRFGGLNARYGGDVFLFYLTVMKKDHDFLPAPLYLFNGPAASPTVYRGALELREPGSSGEAWYDPEAGMLTVRIVEKGMTVFDKSFSSAGEGRDGDFRVAVTATGHFGRFEFRRHSYRKQMLWILGLLVLAVLGRMILKPSQVYLRTDEEKTFFVTEDRKIGKMLSEE